MHPYTTIQIKRFYYDGTKIDCYYFCLYARVFNSLKIIVVVNIIKYIKYYMQFKDNDLKILFIITRSLNPTPVKFSKIK